MADTILLDWCHSPLDTLGSQTFRVLAGESVPFVFRPKFSAAAITAGHLVQLVISATPTSPASLVVNCTLNLDGTISGTIPGASTQQWNGAPSWQLWDTDGLEVLAVGDAQVDPSSIWISGSIPAGWGTVATIDTDPTFAANSDSRVPSQKAVKTALALKATLGADVTFGGLVAGMGGLSVSADGSDVRLGLARLTGSTLEFGEAGTDVMLDAADGSGTFAGGIRSGIGGATSGSVAVMTDSGTAPAIILDGDSATVQIGILGACTVIATAATQSRTMTLPDETGVFATRTYVGTQIAALVNSSPAALDTLKELADALGDDPAFSATVATSLGNRLRVDTAAQGLSGTQKTNAKTNLDLNNVENTALSTWAGGSSIVTVGIVGSGTWSSVLKGASETAVNLGATMSGTITANFASGNVQYGTLTGNVTLVFSNPPTTGTSGTLTLILTGDGTHTITWPGSVDWGTAGAPATLGSAVVTIFSFLTINGGTKWRAAYVGGFG